MSTTARVVTILLLCLSLPQSCTGHGRLLEPPGRSSMWRPEAGGFPTPKNYNDNALYCGGFANQYGRQGGKCGICGDPYQGPRENEAGGLYATGIITRKYTQGQVIDVTVEVTANHVGWFEFKLCPNNNVHKPATQDCLDRHVLQKADGSGSKLSIGRATGRVNVKLRLPNDVTCTQCVFQWRWHTANSWGTDQTGKGCLGCGNQEEFYGCSDVSIAPANGNPQGNPGHLATTPFYPFISQSPRPNFPFNTPKPSTAAVTQTPFFPWFTLTPKLPVTTKKPTFPVVTPVVTRRPLMPVTPQGSSRCRARDFLRRDHPEYDEWCDLYCQDRAKCPVQLCICFY